MGFFSTRLTRNDACALASGLAHRFVKEGWDARYWLANLEKFLDQELLIRRLQDYKVTNEEASNICKQAYYWANKYSVTIKGNLEFSEYMKSNPGLRVSRRKNIHWLEDTPFLDGFKKK